MVSGSRNSWPATSGESGLRRLASRRDFQEGRWGERRGRQHFRERRDVYERDSCGFSLTGSTDGAMDLEMSNTLCYLITMLVEGLGLSLCYLVSRLFLNFTF